jgi:hypothetical protein
LGASPIAGITGTAICLEANGNGVLNASDELKSLNLTDSYFAYMSKSSRYFGSGLIKVVGDLPKPSKASYLVGRIPFQY